MKLISLQELQEIATQYIDDAKIANPNWTPSVNEYTGLIKKIFAQVMIDGSFSEKLEFMDGYTATTGESIEEYFLGFIAPTPLDPSGADALAPHYIDTLPATYSSRLGEKVWPVTQRYSELQDSMLSEEAFRGYMSRTMQRLYDSLTLYLNDCKRQLLGDIAKRAHLENAVQIANGTSYKRGTIFVNGVEPKSYAVAVKNFTAQSGDVDISQVVARGDAIYLDTFTEMAIPTDSATGEAFIKDVKKYAEAFQFPSQGYSLNGNIAGVAPKYILLVKKGVFPSLEVDTMSGAFHLDKLGFGVEAKPVKDFGDNQNVFAMLIDERAAKLHNNTRYTLDQVNAAGGFITYVIHDNETAFYSPNTMVHVWYKPTI